MLNCVFKNHFFFLNRTFLNRYFKSQTQTDPKTALCGQLRGPSHLFVSFPTLNNYFSTVLVWLGSTFEEPTYFSFI
jgi:hypothetical protein